MCYIESQGLRPAKLAAEEAALVPVPDLVVAADPVAFESSSPSHDSGE